MYYEINEETARTAQQLRSFSDYVPGSATAEYRDMVDEAARIAETVKQKCKTEAQRDRVDTLLNRYAKILSEYLNEESRIGCMCPSVMISGGSNFPVRKKEKQVAAWNANHERFKQAESILSEIRTAASVSIKSNDPEVIPALEKKLAALQAAHTRMKEANAYYRKHKTLDGCPGIDDKTREWLTKPGVFACGDGSPIALYKCPYPTYVLSSNNAKIKSVAARLEKLRAEKNAVPVEESDKDAGFSYVENTDMMRIQFIFDGKPDEETRGILKGNGFRWAPSQGAWQRQLTDNGRRAAENVKSALRAMNEGGKSND